MLKRAIVIGSCVLAFGLPSMSQAQSHSHLLSAAVDAQGVRHLGAAYRGREPWISDAIKKVQPRYPFGNIGERRNQGSGLFRLTLDLRTGSVRNVTVLASTGFPELDRSAIAALSRWLWKPGQWKEVDIPVI